MNITYQEALAKTKKNGQEHILQYYDALSETEQQELLEQIECTDFSVVEACLHQEELSGKGNISPLKVMEIDEINASKEMYLQTGIQAIQKGKVGAVLLAGGMGTRLGSDEPKGMYNIGITKDVYIFERLICNLLETVKQADTWIHLFVMTSDKNHDATVRFLTEHTFFGYNSEYVHFFKQEMAPAADYQGKIYMESRSKMSTSPNGNGGWYISMKNAGLLDVVKREGMEWLNVFSVDNVLQKIVDPIFVGAVIANHYVVGSKVVKKTQPDEKVGVMCLKDGKPSIVEYYELTEEMMHAKNENGTLAYNFGVILNYLFQEEALQKIMEQKLPLHVVEKKIPYMNEEGELIKPETVNGYKFESLVLDMIHEMENCLPFEVERKKEFAPIKNKTGVDSVETARVLLIEHGVEL